MWIAGKLESRFLRQAAFLLFGIVAFRFCFFDLSRQFGPRNRPVGLTYLEYGRLLLERIVIFGVPIASFAGAYRLLSRRDESGRTVVQRDGIASNAVLRVLFVGAFALLFLYVHLEFNRSFGFFYEPLRMPMLTVLWLAMCALILYEFLRLKALPVMELLLFFVAIVLVKLFVFDVATWGLSRELTYGTAYSPHDGPFRLMDFGLVIAFLILASRLMQTQTEVRYAAVTFAWLALVLFFVYMSLETNSFFQTYLPGMQSGAISILWSLFAIGLLLTGIGYHQKSTRYVGLVLFGVVTWKVFFVDLAQLDSFYRIIAFIVLGILLLFGSFLYLRYRETFALESATETPEKEPSS